MRILLLSALLVFSHQGFSQSYSIDSLIIKNINGKVIKKYSLEASIKNTIERIEFRNSHNEVITIFQKTVPKASKGVVRFISYNKSYELIFFEIGDRWIEEKYVDFTKFYHIKEITR